MNELYKMKLGQRIKFDIWDVWRVPGGWLFTMNMQSTGFSVFVPYNNEFDTNKYPF